MKRSILVVGLVAGLLTTAFGQADFLRTKIPFEFEMAGKNYPAGIYEFSDNNKFVTAKNSETGETIRLGFLAPVAADAKAQGKVRISFAVSGDKRMLEAIWPQRGKGYLLRPIKKGETRESLRVQP